MARTNQGIFQKLINKFESLQMEYEQAIEQYFEDGDYDSNCDFFSDFAHTADSVYIQADELMSDIKGMLQATKFEDKENQEKYQEILLSVEQIKNEVKEKFDNILEMINISGGCSEIERETLDNLCIYYGKKRYWWFFLL